MRKLCNVRPRTMITLTTGRPFDYEKKNLVLNGREIEYCMARGQVDEVLNDGTVRTLNKDTYRVEDEKTIVDIDAYLAGLAGEVAEASVEETTEDPVEETPADPEAGDDEEVMG